MELLKLMQERGQGNFPEVTGPIQLSSQGSADCAGCSVGGAYSSLSRCILKSKIGERGKMEKERLLGDFGSYPSILFQKETRHYV